jgi:hypothetical protein
MFTWILIGLMIFGACAPEPTLEYEESYVTLNPISSALPSTLAASPTTAPTPRFDESACQVDRTQRGIRYDIHATLDWTLFTVGVEETVTYRNDSERVLDTIVFNVENDGELGNFELKRIVGASDSDYGLTGTLLTVPLDEPLLPNCETELTLKFKLTIPEIADGYQNGHLGYWGRSDRQVNLGMWFPLVAALDNEQGWIVPPSHWLGEHFVLPMADFAVEIKVRNAPDGVKVAGPGQMSQPDDLTWRFELVGGRELALSFSTVFGTLSTLTPSGVNVELFYLINPEAESLDTPRHALYTAADALMLYEEWFGPYPYQRLIIVEGDFPDGMEFSGLVFVSEAWFRTWKHIPNDWLTLITAHEVAHQWWYGLVGNDQAQYPYLDEALALYCEALFVERYYPEQLIWWWEFRVGMYAPGGYVDTPIYDFYSPRSYIDAVYLRGALMLQALRDNMGDDIFMIWLHHYATTMKGQIAYPRDLWSELPVDVYMMTQPIRASFLKQPDILPLGDNIP